MKLTTTKITFLALAVLTSAVPLDPTRENQSGEAETAGSLPQLAPRSFGAAKDSKSTESAGDLPTFPSLREFESGSAPGFDLGKGLGSPDSAKELSSKVANFGDGDLKSLPGHGANRPGALSQIPGAGSLGAKSPSTPPAVERSQHVARTWGWPPSYGSSGFPTWPPSSGTGGSSGFPTWPPSSGGGTGTTPSPGDGGSSDGGSSSGCKAVTVLFARGTTESGTLGMIVGPGLRQALISDFGEDQVDVEGVPYPADNAGNFNLGATAGQAIAALAKQRLTACPKTKLVLSGYSQGAMGVHNALSAQGVDGSAVAAIVCFGDPFNGQQFQGVDASRVKEFCDYSDTICPGGQKTGVGWHLSYGENVKEAADFIKQTVGSAETQARR